MTRYAPNSAVLTAPGDYRYTLLSVEEARDWWTAGPVEARIGYEETCTALARVHRVPEPPVDRRIITMAEADEALVFRIALAPNERRLAVKAKAREGVERLMRDCEIGLLRRIA